MKNYKELALNHRQQHGETKLRKMFVHRERDELFALIGKCAKKDLKDVQAQIWLGFEILVDSPQLHPSFKV